MEIQYLCPLIQVFDMNASLKFYCEVLGFNIHQSAGEPDWVWLKRDGIDLMLNTAYESEFRPAQPNAVRVAAHDDTILFLGCPNVEEAYQTIRSQGIKLDPPKVAPYGMKQLYLHDPDGYGICFQQPAGNLL